MTLWYADLPSPVGNLRIVASPKGLRELHASAKPPPAPAGAVRDAAATTRYAGALQRYFAGDVRALDNIPLDVVSGTPFQRQVWDALRTIPYGETRSYAWLAGAVGKPGAARAVGQANGANPVAIVVPCHRVVAADGGIGGYAGGIGMKRSLLALEGEHALGRGPGGTRAGFPQHRAIAAHPSGST